MGGGNTKKAIIIQNHVILEIICPHEVHPSMADQAFLIES